MEATTENIRSQVFFVSAWSYEKEDIKVLMSVLTDEEKLEFLQIMMQDDDILDMPTWSDMFQICVDIITVASAMKGKILNRVSRSGLLSFSS